MSRKTENSAFVCVNCGRMVVPLTNGGYRNHCPHCLHSLHVDNCPGDRSSDCGGIMEPVDVIFHSKKGYQIVHRCKRCGVRKSNKIAEDTEMPDDFGLICRLMCTPN